MEYFFVLFFFARLVTLTWADPDFDDLEWDDFLRPTPDQNPLGAPALDNSVGPLPSFVDLNLHLKYDLSLLAQFGGRKEEAEGYLERVVQLAKLFLLHPTLVVKIHIKVITSYSLPFLQCARIVFLTLYPLIIHLSDRFGFFSQNHFSF